jgi:hypothetical protein
VAFIPPGSHRISDLENCHGLLGRCALNTETAAVNPRVGVAGPPRGVAYIPMPSPTRQCFDNLGSLAEIRRLCNPEGGRKLDGGKRVSERHLRYHAHNPRAPRQGRRNVPLSAQPERDPENCSSGDLQWSAVVCSGLQWSAVVCSGLQWSAVVSRIHFLRFFANMRFFLGFHLIILIQ